MTAPFLHRACAAALLLAAALPAPAADYVQQPGSTLVFATKYQGEVYLGRIPAFNARLSFDPANLAASRLDVTMPLAGVTFDHPDAADTVKGADFFDVARFPQARFTASRVRALGGNRYAADGTLALRGVSKPATLEFTWTPGARPVLSGKATLKRLDWNVGGGDWGDTGLIPNEVAVSTRVVFAPAK